MKQFKAQQKKSRQKGKVKINTSDWLNITKRIRKENKKHLGIIAKLKALRTKEDPEKKICQQLIKSMDQKKLNVESAYHLTQTASQTIHSLKGKLPMLLITFIASMVGVILTGFFLFKSIPLSTDLSLWTQSYLWTFWLGAFIMALAFFFRSMGRRKAFESDFMSYAVLAKSSAAYASSRTPGKGGSLFEAYQQLDIINADLKKQSLFGKKNKDKK